MTKSFKRKTFLVGALMAGSLLFNVGNCTTTNVKAQLSKGLSSTLTGIFNISSTGVADEVFDVDD